MLRSSYTLFTLHNITGYYCPVLQILLSYSTNDKTVALAKHWWLLPVRSATLQGAVGGFQVPG